MYSKDNAIHFHCKLIFVFFSFFKGMPIYYHCDFSFDLNNIIVFKVKAF